MNTNLSDEDHDYLNTKVEEYNQRVYQGQMDGRQKAVYKEMLRKEYEFWAREAVRVDNNTGADDQ